MSYVTTGSSNLVSNGSPIQLEIKISQDSLRPILLMGMFTIENLNNIAKEDNSKNLNCELFGNTGNSSATPTVSIFKFNYVENDPGKRICRLSKSFSDIYSYITLKISGLNCNIQSNTTDLKISFKDQNNKDEQDKPIENIILFNVKTVVAKPEIISFDANPAVLQGNTSQLGLTWKTKGEQYILREGLKELLRGTGDGKYNFQSIGYGDHVFTLEVKIGDTSVTKSVQVRALDSSQLSPKANPEKPYVIGNMCVGQDSYYLFSLILNNENESAQIDHIGYTNEGFSGQWSEIKLSDDDKKTLKSFATSPMVHLRDTGEVYGRLIFIGGSHVKPVECSNAVAIVDLDTDAVSRVTVYGSLPWSSRMGHSCTIFPHGGVDKIWLLGGVDEWGAAQSDVWVSGDGINWINITENGSATASTSTPAAMPWKARCLAGISVELNDDGTKKALWFGGGFSEIGGKETADIWKFEQNAWSNVMIIINNKSKQDVEVPLNIFNNDPENGDYYSSSALSFIGRNPLDSSVMYSFGAFKKSSQGSAYFNKILGGPINYSLDPVGENLNKYLIIDNYSCIITAYYRGALWFLSLSNIGDKGINIPDLIYYIPFVTSKTIRF